MRGGERAASQERFSSQDWCNLKNVREKNIVMSTQTTGASETENESMLDAFCLSWPQTHCRADNDLENSDLPASTLQCARYSLVPPCPLYGVSG